MFCGSGGSKSRLAKWRVRRHLDRWEINNCTQMWREAHFEVKMLKTPHVRNTFGSWDVETVHAIVARSKFGRAKCQNTPSSEHFRKLRCWKSTRRCCAKHISKWNGTKHLIVGARLEVEMSKKCTPLWREAHLEIKNAKNWGSRVTFWSLDVTRQQLQLQVRGQVHLQPQPQ